MHVLSQGDCAFECATNEIKPRVIVFDLVEVSFPLILNQLLLTLLNPALRHRILLSTFTSYFLKEWAATCRLLFLPVNLGAFTSELQPLAVILHRTFRQW